MEFSFEPTLKPILKSREANQAVVDFLRSQIESVPEQIWTVAARRVNPYELLKDVGSNHVLNRAYYKLYEILWRYNMFNESGPSPKTVHLCEAPGAFVQATIDFCQRTTGQTPQWYGVTLPQKIPWQYSPSSKNIIYADVIHDPLPVERLKGAWLVTGDGGFDVQDENDKEISHFLLIKAQVQHAISLLREGGHMVIKMFDMYTLDTMKLLCHALKYFKSVRVVKPLGSRICNSEKYLVGLYFTGGIIQEIDGEVPSWAESTYNYISEQFSLIQMQSLFRALHHAAQIEHDRVHWRQMIRDLKRDPMQQENAVKVLKWLGLQT